MRNEFYYFEIKGPFRGFCVLQISHHIRFHVRFNFYVHFYVHVHVHPNIHAACCHEVWPWSEVMQHGYATGTTGHAAWTSSVEKQRGHAA
jgi:hypothetical protein